MDVTRPEHIHGSWTLRSWRSIDDAGDAIFPMGTEPTGWIHYLPDGRMAVVLSEGGRADFETGDLLAGTPTEKAAAFETFIAYTGGYTVHEGYVVHHIDVCSFPNWVGTEQKRYARIDGATLTLSTDPILQRGSVRQAFLEWERVRPE